MPFENIPTTFCTDPGNGLSTSRYYTFKNGLIRAKFAAEEIHLRPGKNICYVDAGLDVSRSSSNPKSMKVGSSYVSYELAMEPTGGYQVAAVGKVPVDFYLTAANAYLRSFHHGHGITADFDAKIAGKAVDESKFDAYIRNTYVDSADPGRLRDDVDEETLEMTELDYEAWLKT